MLVTKLLRVIVKIAASAHTLPAEKQRCLWADISCGLNQWRTQEFFSGGGRGSTNSVEDRADGALGMVAPQSGVLEAAVIWYKKFHFI